MPDGLASTLVRRVVRACGFDITRLSNSPAYPDVSSEDMEILRAVKPYTMTSPERVLGLINATRYVVSNRIPGAIVECGVWRGGSMMAVAKVLLEEEKDPTRELYLFDTFEGMPTPSTLDLDHEGNDAKSLMSVTKKNEASSVWCYAPLEGVRKRIASTTYPSNLVHFVAGRVEETIPAAAPGAIALLRLDTDWYESTSHELVHLFPRVSSGGAIIIDDYGHWRGARKAVDEYIAETGAAILLNRLDYSGRIGVKP
jgi:O-methyltransferase